MLLYDFQLSAECYCVRLFCALLDLRVETRWIDAYPGAEHCEAAFLAVSPRGTLPLLDLGDERLEDWQAILLRLARDHDPSATWLPPSAPGSVMPWMEVAQELADTAGRARLHDALGMEADIDSCRVVAHRVLRRIEAHLWWQERSGHGWLLAGQQPTVADVALFPHAALCEEGGVGRMDYPAVRRWIDRVRRLPRFIVTSGIFALPGLEVQA